MAIDVNTGDILMVRLEYLNDEGTIAYNVLHYRLKDPVAFGGAPPYTPGLYKWSQVGPGTAAAFYDEFAGVWQDTASDEVTFTGCTVQCLYPDTRSAQYHYVSGIPTPGSIDDQALPLQDSPTLLKQTAYGTRWGLGRFFAVGTPEVWQQNGKLVDAAIVPLGALAGLLDNIVDVTVDNYRFPMQPILYAPQPVGAPRITDIVDANLSDRVLKTQRRRRPGKGI